jgi:hypothetical protein
LMHMRGVESGEDFGHCLIGRRTGVFDEIE